MLKTNRFKETVTKLRTSIKFFIVFAISIALIVCVVYYIYKPIYKVSFLGKEIGYTENKSALQKRINDYAKNGEGENVAFVDIKELPTYELCMSKKEMQTNDEEIIDAVRKTGIMFYKYYAVTLDSEEKYYVSSKEDAENVVEQLKEKNSNNIDKIGFIEKYGTDLKTFEGVDSIVTALYVKPKPKVTTYASYTSTPTTVSYEKVELGIGLINPISGIISSRFGGRWGGTHTGLDIAAPTGTPITAAASGIVEFADYSGGYGNIVKISHGNGIVTYYAHCNELYVSPGESISQGQIIATVGSTGNSTGSHLHLEVRVNGVAQDPQYYVY